MRRIGLLLLLLTVVSLAAGNMLMASDTATTVTSDEALQMLKDGNARYAAGTPSYPHQTADRRTLTATEGQKPFVTVLTCSDSRVPAEMLFDQGIGDVFVIRVAGNVADVDEAGSIEYGVDHLNTPLLVVLGHTSCGAVGAVVDNAEVHGNIPPLVENIKPAVARAKSNHPDLTGKPLIDQAVRENVWQSIQDLLNNSDTVRRLVGDGKLQIVGAVYDLKSGSVEWLGQLPTQESILKSYPTEDAPGH